MNGEFLSLSGTQGIRILRLYNLYRLAIGLVLVVLASSNLDSELLELANERRANSRLSCQITLTAAQDGMQVHTPEGQH